MTPTTRRRRREPLVALPTAARQTADDVVAEQAARLFLGHVGDYLQATGWRALVAGPITVERLEGYRWRLVVDFTGGEQTAPLPAISQHVTTLLPRRRPRPRS